MHNQISKNTVLHFKHQVVRDLAWSLWGPALLIHEKPYDEDSTQASYFPVDVPWLLQLDDQPSGLIEYLDKKNTPLLGTYFEALWQFYFSFHPSFKQSICNLQINDQNRTVGEFDVLVTDTNEQNFHVELTCKFYLEWKDSLNNRLWLGPNCGDRLDFKYHKTQTRQLPLLKTELGQLNYQQHAINQNPVRQIGIWRGTFFPITHYFTVDTLDSLPKPWRKNEDILWCIADKHLWLSPLVQSREALKTFNQIKQDITHHFNDEKTETKSNDKERPTLMLVALAFDEGNNQWQQQEAFFITPNTWPYGKFSDSALTPLRPCNPPL